MPLPVQTRLSEAPASAAVYSMTGFARVSGRVTGSLCYTLTLKSINHRFLDLQLRMPAGMEVLEAQLRGLLKTRLVRGHIECVLTLERARPGAGRNGDASTLGFDPRAVSSYIESFRAMAAAHGLACEPDLNALLRLPGVVASAPAGLPQIEERGDQAAEDAALTETLPACLEEALLALKSMRAEEGRLLAEVLRDGLSRLRGLVEEVAGLRADVQRAHFERLSARLESLLGEHFDRDRVLQEAALLAERSDVEEEIARMRTHIAHFESLLDAGGELGKKLDFLLQEMNREANTLLSKTGGVAGKGTRITECGLGMKSEIEKAREQVQNVE